MAFASMVIVCNCVLPGDALMQIGCFPNSKNIFGVLQGNDAVDLLRVER